jgi:rubrerythrin
MIKENETSETCLSEFIYKIEMQGLNFYKQLIHKTNQYSTKFILQKIFIEHQKHVENLKLCLDSLRDEVIVAEQFADVSLAQVFKIFEQEYKPKNLTFVEATKLAGRILENYVEIYEKLLNENISSDWRRAIEQILEKKSAYLQQIHNEHERLRYKK